MARRSERQQNPRACELRARRIRALLALGGVTQVDLAASLDVSRAYLTQVILGERRSTRLRAAVAECLRVQTAELWPLEHYPVPAESTPANGLRALPIRAQYRPDTVYTNDTGRRPVTEITDRTVRRNAARSRAERAAGGRRG
jgi:transcriptional regulator with XRE-family HTH domain